MKSSKTPGLRIHPSAGRSAKTISSVQASLLTPVGLLIKIGVFVREPILLRLAHTEKKLVPFICQIRPSVRCIMNTHTVQQLGYLTTMAKTHLK